ncbi:SRPBCC family protein [Fredinandcohnia humi]
MLAAIEKYETTYIATFERHYRHSVEEVWSMLTDNDKLPLWFSELRVDNLREGGHILFDMQDGTFEEMTITDLQIGSVLEYTWGDDIVRFELFPEKDGCQLLLIETITKLTSHTPRDLAGWHVCLDVIGALLDGRPIPSRKEEWEKWYQQYVKTIKELT